LAERSDIFFDGVVLVLTLILPRNSLLSVSSASILNVLQSC